jgi:site-specific DNA-methyltransferase (adenine-specific)
MIELNKIYCEECGKLLKDLDNNSIDLICIDPPYLTTNEKWDKKEVVNEELSRELFRIAKDSCSLYVWCGIGEISQSLIRWFPIFSKNWHFKDLITWKKQRGIGMRKGWLYTREEIMWYVKDNKKFIWNKEEQYSKEPNQFKVGMNGTKVHPTKRYSNVWTDIPEKLTRNTKFHYTPKPIKAIERIIKLHTKENDVVIDCFMGSGTTAEACKILKRNFIGVEIDSKYCEIANKRLEQLCI